MALAPNDVYVRYLATSDGVSRVLADTLSRTEVARAARFHFERDRASYTAAHGMLRLLLTELFGETAPREWRFTASARGRPELDHPRLTDVHFSLSHTDGMAACAITCGREVGVDVESIDRPAPWDIAEDCLTTGERADLATRPVEEQDERFFFLWTLKEAYVKALGHGLRVPPRLIEIQDDSDGGLRASTEEQWVVGRGKWHLESHRVGRFRLAVCVQANEAVPQIRIQEFS